MSVSMHCGVCGSIVEDNVPHYCTGTRTAVPTPWPDAVQQMADESVAKHAARERERETPQQREARRAAAWAMFMAAAMASKGQGNTWDCSYEADLALAEYDRRWRDLGGEKKE